MIDFIVIFANDLADRGLEPKIVMAILLVGGIALMARLKRPFKDS